MQTTFLSEFLFFSDDIFYLSSYFIDNQPIEYLLNKKI